MFGGEQAARINGPGEKVIEMDQSAGRFHLLLLAQVGTKLFGELDGKKIIGNI
jgi:hypothetical protein